MIIQIITTFLPWTAVTCFTTIAIARKSNALSSDNLFKLMAKWCCATIIMTLLLTALMLFIIFTTEKHLYEKFTSILIALIFGIVCGWGLVNSADTGRLMGIPFPLLLAFELLGFLVPTAVLPSILLEKVFV